jgi:topoisomerase-4 subunit A
MAEKAPTSSIVDVDFKQALSERYLSYALSTIMARSLPDVRDGLKPVHRRLIYAMQQLKLNPGSGFKKCARVVGDVMGKFHPHGDAAIYNALVRLAQDFSVRYPLIDGQGNFGNIDGDNPAAMRYTEARLCDITLHLLDGLDENAVDFRPTYDGEEDEPTVLPAAFPNVLANGATGIAVGMATSIPPHNVDELCSALIHLIDHPTATVAELMAFVPGPDFPTGGMITESPETIRHMYETGRGSLRVRSLWEKEERKGGAYVLVVTQIPYMVEKSKLIEKIANLMGEKKLPLLEDIVDESTDELRIVIHPRSRNVEAAHVMEALFRQTDLEVRVAVNMNVLDSAHTPRVLSLKEILCAFIDHRRHVTIRRTEHRLGQIATRLEILEGYLVVYLNLDEVIRIIRDEDEPKAVLMARFSLTENQVEAILNMRLRSLRKLQEIEIRAEHAALREEREELTKLLGSTGLQNKHIQKELKAIQKKFGVHTPVGKRRTLITGAPTAVVVPIDVEIEREDVTLVLSQKNWIRIIKGHGPADIKYKEGDEARFVIATNTVDKLVLLAHSGRCFTLAVDKLPRSRSHGEALRLLIDLPPEEDIIAAVTLKPGDEGLFMVASTDGRGFGIKAPDLLAQTKVGRIVLTPGDGSKAATLKRVEGDHVAVMGNNRKLLIFPIHELPVMARGRGVILQKYKEGRFNDCTLITLQAGLAYKRGGTLHILKDLRPWLGSRASTGRLAPTGFPHSNRFEG